jgi:hypothetical protein
MDTQVNPTLATHKASMLATTKEHEAHVSQHALDQVLSSPFFRNTLQCQNLLRYIVRHSVAGEDHLLRERVIGSEVFGRRPDYEPGEDPVVRLRASEVRKRLAQYYHSVAEIPDVYIEIPAGSYRAVFRRREETPPTQHLEPAVVASPEPLAPEVTPEQVPPIPEPHDLVIVPGVPLRTGNKPGWRTYAPLAGLVLIICAIVFAPSLVGGENVRFREFWAPWINARKPLIIAIGSNAVYRLSDSVSGPYGRAHGLGTHGEEFFVPFAPTDNVHGSDIMPADASFVALGDVVSISHIVANITRQKQTFQERFPNDISFAEIRNSPSILVGGFNNPMTIERTKKLRFVLRARDEIDDTQDPNRRWILNASPDSHDTEDYAIITRVVNWNSGDAPMISVAGMGQYGTLAAADFICSPTAISATVRKLPEHWQDRNLQVILHVKVVDFKVAATDVVALHAW